MRWIKQRRMSVQLYHRFFVYTCGEGGLTSHPCSRASLSLTTRLSDSKEETHKKLKTTHTYTHTLQRGGENTS